MRLALCSVEHWSRRATDNPAAARAQKSGWDEDCSATNPARAPGEKNGKLGVYPATEEVVGEQLDEERGLVSVKVGARCFTDSEPVFELADEWLNAGARIVAASKLVDVAEAVVGHKELNGKVESFPKEPVDRYHARWYGWR